MTTKYPKFRAKITTMTEDDCREYARTSVNVMTNKLCMMDLDFLPDTAQLAEGIDVLEEILKGFIANPSFTDEEVNHYKAVAKDTAVMLLAEEGYVAGENPFGD